MIQITVRVVPDGDQSKAFDVAVAEAKMLPGEGAFRGYAVSAGEAKNPWVGSLEWSSHGHVLLHDVRQSAWALVARVATWASAEAEKAAQR
jgi:hypothetical protein